MNWGKENALQLADEVARPSFTTGYLYLPFNQLLAFTFEYQEFLAYF